MQFAIELSDDKVTYSTNPSSLGEWARSRLGNEVALAFLNRHSSVSAGRGTNRQDAKDAKKKRKKKLGGLGDSNRQCLEQGSSLEPDKSHAQCEITDPVTDPVEVQVRGKQAQVEAQEGQVKQQQVTEAGEC